MKTIYLWDLLIQYTFTASASELLSDCAANIHVFTNYANYFYFIITGLVHFAYSSICLSAESSENFTLSATDIDQYFFVGLKSSIDLNYTRISNILEYDITNLSSTNCTFSSASSECLVSLDNSRSGDTCVFASLLQTEFHVYIPLNYTTESRKYYEFTSTSLSLEIILISCVSLSFVIIILWKYKCNPSAYFKGYFFYCFLLIILLSYVLILTPYYYII